MLSHHHPLSSGPLSSRHNISSILHCLPGCSNLLLYLLLPSLICHTCLSSSADLHRSVCAFPSLGDPNGCQRGSSLSDEQLPLLNGWFCDPGSTISMSEVFAIDETVRRIYAQNRRNCVCQNVDDEEAGVRKLVTSSNEDGSPNPWPPSADHCWYRFGFAFVPSLDPAPDAQNAEQCAAKNTSTEFEEENGSPSFADFAQNYARVLRERWRLGRCGEDILVLVVQRPPQQLSAGPLSSAHSRLFGPLPVTSTVPQLFVSVGSLVLNRLPQLGLVHTFDMLVQQANSQLQRDARPLFRVLNEFLVRLQTEVLAQIDVYADNAERLRRPTASDPRARHHHHQRFTPRSHIPLWAWAVFAACGVAFGLMALGLFLIRTRTRRGGTPAGCKQKAMANRRHWKEGGEEQLPPPTTYVNLVQMLMPYPKQPPVNMPQLV